MFKLNNVSKTYLSKGKQKVEALKDVNLEIKDRGLVFILGKSGSGKSTLLNILGGIDGATSGEIFVDGHSFADFKQADYDNYRNRYVGFVFQEFNLLNDFDVAGNVALALKLSGEKNFSEKVTNALQSVGLSTDYLTRKTDELSGGEKQRVAIARAIVKDSKVILADEPTGNLDSGTGESIWNILKDLSKTKLVIVVTHDRESAEKYGDRIIEIADGRIISDSGEQTESKEPAQAFSFQKNSLSNAVCFRMGFNNLSQRKVKSVSVVLLAIFTIFVILLTQILLCFSTEKTLAKLVLDNGIEHIVITQGKVRDSKFGAYNYMLDSTAKYIETNTDYIKNNFVEGKQDILDVGLTFVGDALELDDNSFYLTSLKLEKIYLYENSSVEIDGEKVRLSQEEHPVEFLVGKKIYFGGFGGDGTYYTLAGVIDITKFDPDAEGAAIPSYFAKESFAGHEIVCTNQNVYDIPDVTLEFNGRQYSGEFESKNELYYVTWNGGKILTEKGLQDKKEVELAGDEIVLSYEMYAKLFSAGSKWSYVSRDLTEVLYVPQHIGQRFSFKLYDYDTGTLLCDAGELKLAGIGFSTPSNSTNSKPTFVVGKPARTKINTALSPQRYLVEVASVRNLQKFLVDFRNKHDGYIIYAGGYLRRSAFSKDEQPYAPVVYEFEEDISLFKIIFLTIATVLSLILLLLVMNLISFSIMNRKKEIGILSAMGATNRDLTKIFLIETFLISAVTFVFNVVAIFVASAIFNKYFSSPIAALTAPFLRIDIFTFITLIVASFGLLLVAALIPIRKIIKLKPIDAIKNL